MQIKAHKQYEKAWTKLTRPQQKRALAALRLFLATPDDPRLRLHRLKGKYYPQYSISAGGDLRIHLLKVDKQHIILMLVGTHSRLYG